ncbi:AAA+-type ATPase [Handroanthus impetiginosus]|uniref:AAA+-type ATPase n=1 Tax=Handroanthus impetiginosus TaxID=429701 RepID=A0A2G9GYX4_9LAMI|nr:AAA+-type ATPase [Handroanthus impetiginosus]
MIAGFMFIKAILERYFPNQLRNYIEKHFQKLFNFLSPYVQITFNEFNGKRLTRSEAYSATEAYLSSTSAAQAQRLKAEILKKRNNPLSLTMDDNEEVSDEYKGVKVLWASGKTISSNQNFSEEKRFYSLKFHEKHRNFIIETYINQVLKQGNLINEKNRQRKLFTNSGSYWNHVPFEHPATFQTLAMESEKKRDIVDDLLAFSKGGEFYSRIGRAWKRGYLLYGPPGTGKSTMVAAMANLLEYDLYDLGLTAVKDNTELKELLIAISSKAIVVIEDIDCSADLMGERAKKQENDNATASRNSKITLSGLLNFIDGLWSTCGGERIIVFTTNFVEKLDPALIRKGRMDKHIEMSYCGFEAFKVLAKNYLGLEWHNLFPRIESLLGMVKMSPADVAEILINKSGRGDVEICLRNLILTLEGAEREVGMEDEDPVGMKKTLD